MAYMVTFNWRKPNREQHWFDTFRAAYDASRDVDDAVSISFDNKEWVYKTKEDVWPTDDCVENLSIEYKNEQDVENGYWVCFLPEAPNSAEILNSEINGDITPEEREEMLERACIVQVLNEYTFMNRFGYFAH